MSDKPNWPMATAAAVENQASVIRYRPFLNCDPPGLVRVWREQPIDRGLMQPISILLLEMFVLSKPYFDRDGLIVAEDADGQVLGFSHGGFGPNVDGGNFSPDIGLVCMLAVRPHEQRGEVMRELLARCEAYLRARGAKELRVGGTFPYSPFYMGMYGGSDLPGIMKSDDEMNRFYREQGYEMIDECVAFERSLHRYRPPIDRQLLQHRRQYRLIAQVNPNESSWWEACVFGPTDRIRFLLASKSSTKPCGEITYWDMGPLSTRNASGGMGLINLQIDEPFRGHGLGLFLATESLIHLENSGIHRIESQTHLDNEVRHRILKKLNFVPLREGVSYRKTA
jgi:GNAT superfamily N-acetyltransferase